MRADLSLNSFGFVFSPGGRIQTTERYYISKRKFMYFDIGGWLWISNFKKSRCLTKKNKKYVPLLFKIIGWT